LVQGKPGLTTAELTLTLTLTQTLTLPLTKPSPEPEPEPGLTTAELIGCFDWPFTASAEAGFGEAELRLDTPVLVCSGSRVEYFGLTR
jgi:hypothetical protein